MAAAGRGELLVQRVEVVGSETAKRDVTDGRVHVAVDEPRVPVRGRGSHVSPLLRKPGAGHELAERDRAALRRRRPESVLGEPEGNGFRLGSVVADRVPSAAFLAGQWIDAVIGDDVEAVLALNDVGHGHIVDVFDANPKRIWPVCRDPVR